VLKSNTGLVAIIVVALVIGFVLPSSSPDLVIDPEACIGCGICAESCVRPESAVKAQIDQSKLERIEFNPAMFRKVKGTPSSGAENLVCPTNAIVRTKVNDTTWNYAIESAKCIGCGGCTVRSKMKGDGAFTLNVTDDCFSCNECAIEVKCPTGAISHRKGAQ